MSMSFLRGIVVGIGIASIMCFMNEDRNTIYNMDKGVRACYQNEAVIDTLSNGETKIVWLTKEAIWAQYQKGGQH